MKTSIPESTLAAFWKRHAPELTGLVTEEDGSPVTIIFPGNLNDDHGADFRDAVLATRKGLTIGDVELHADSRGWWAHHHHRDPVYNRVVLHVVVRHGCGRAAELQNGRTAPTLLLGRYLDIAPALPPSYPDVTSHLPCAAYRETADPVATGEILDAAGDARFRAKTDTFRTALATNPPEDVLYTALLEALGYRRNRDSMRRLADAIPVSELYRVFTADIPDDEYVFTCQGLLLGTAGLLPSQREQRSGGNGDNDRVRRLESCWERYGCPRTLTEQDWHFSRVRPGNYPVRRIAAAGYLLQRFRGEGLVRGIIRCLEKAVVHGPRSLIDGLTVPASGYWHDYLDFGQLSTAPAPALCGSGRAADIAVNAVLPFAAAYQEGRTGATAMDLYRSFPALPDNSILGNMRKLLGMTTDIRMSARRQQGLIHVHHTWCSAGNCAECPFGRDA